MGAFLHTLGVNFVGAFRGVTLTLAGLLCSLACVAAIAHGGWTGAVWTALFGALAIGVTSCRARARLAPLALAQDMLALALLAVAVAPDLGIWQTPAAWRDLPRLSSLGAACGGLLYLLTVLSGVARRRPLAAVTRLLLWFVPFLPGALFVLGATGLMAQLGDWLMPWEISPALAAILGRTVLLWTWGALVLTGLGQALDRRWLDARLYGLLFGSAAGAALTPCLADWGGSAWVAELSAPWRLLAVVGAAALAQTGLWAQTYAITGALLDAIGGRRPRLQMVWNHARQGAGKGAVYGAWFFLLVAATALLAASPSVMAMLREHPGLGGAVLGALLFPLLKTIVETFDGSPPLRGRLLASALLPANYLHGLVAGAGVGYAIGLGGYLWDGPTRFGYGALLGVLAYTGVALAMDTWAILRGARGCLQVWRVYLLTALLGGLVGGALAWYFDAVQLVMVSEKLFGYAAVHYPGAGRPVADYVIYPLFSKWGAMNLGAVGGGVRLFYNESLSGVIAWSLAAPLFSINLVLLNALLGRSLAPLRELATGQGLARIAENALRVQRWGLWMAPVIYSFLRMAPDPAWYNQDGAVRTLLALAQSWNLDAQAYRGWSLELFLGLMAYDWLRVLIWFDHMGLRVATLINLSFGAADRLDEKVARWLGHQARARAFPESIRRFATWAPLLLPFYIPRGAEWDYVWQRSAALHAASPGLSPPVLGLVTAYGVAALVIGGGLALAVARSARRRPAHPTPRLVLGNGLYTLELGEDGGGFSRVLRPVRGQPEIDISRRRDDPLSARGKTFYAREWLGADMGAEASPAWSLLPQAGRTASHSLTALSPTTLRCTSEHAGIGAEVEVCVAATDPLEVWRIRLVNRENRPRSIELASFQELVLNQPDVYERRPAWNALFVGTWFVPSLRAILAHSRLAKNGEQATQEVAFHAADAGNDGPVRLVGYQDARARCLEGGALRAPAGLDDSRRDGGLLYTFDPAASLRVRLELPALGALEVRFADGYARDAQAAARLINHYLPTPMPDLAILAAELAQTRALVDRPWPEQAHFSADGRELAMPACTPRPLHHVLANALGHGAVVSNAGEICAFAGNVQQNALTPFVLDSVPREPPGEVMYVLELATGQCFCPTWTPLRRAGAEHSVTFGLGYARFGCVRRELELELTAFAPPDAPLQLRLLRLRNRGARAASYRVAPYFEVVLAELPRDSRGALLERSDPTLGALYFANPRNDFVPGWAFVATSLDEVRTETLRSRFVGGPGRDLSNPHWVEHGAPNLRQPDDGRRVAAFAGEISLPAGGEITLSVVLGQAATIEEAAGWVRRYRSVDAARQALEETRRDWRDTLSVLRVESNLPEFDRLVNDWLPYQTLSARLWGRTGPQQRGGAFGFRDQLQDALPWLVLKPALARRQILLHAAQQFREGDVFHWWHPIGADQTGFGDRGRASDPHLWLPYVTTRYLRATGDLALLDEPVAFLEGRAIPRGALAISYAPRRARETASLYQHCQRAVALSLARLGRHGLPLIGVGDWNDALDRVGRRGRGESVWLGFFLYDVLRGMVEMAAMRDDEPARTAYAAQAARLAKALDAMWRDGRYVRAITDAGQELLHPNALTAAWPLLSGAVAPERGAAALAADLPHLERADMVLVQDPPFTEQSRPWPGRIADYPPGVRENGGQYSHGSSWLVDALVVGAEQAVADGQTESAAALRAHAFELWWKISPLSKTDPDTWSRYGLSPHQQAADVYSGPGHQGHGGWSWYTGAAARMLVASYALLGLRVQDGELVVADDLLDPRGRLQLRRLTWHGREIAVPKDADGSENHPS